MEEYLKALEGITYADWIKLRTAIDREFQHRISELSNTVKLTDSGRIEKLIHSQFG